MRFSCGYTREGKAARKLQKMRDKAGMLRIWTLRFALLPVTVDVTNGQKTCIWLEFYEKCYPNAYVAKQWCEYRKDGGSWVYWKDIDWKRPENSSHVKDNSLWADRWVDRKGLRLLKGSPEFRRPASRTRIHL